MKAYEPKDLNARIDEANNYAWKHTREEIEGREKARKFAPLFRRLGFSTKLQSIPLE